MSAGWSEPAGGVDGIFYCDRGFISLQKGQSILCDSPPFGANMADSVSQIFISIGALEYLRILYLE